MSFGRRQKPPVGQRLADFVYPVGGYGRWVKYLHLKIQRLPGSPHSIALGFACGVGASFTPFYGFHFVTAGLIAWGLGGNILASAFGTAIGNPWTFPFIVAWILYLGQLILGRDTNPEVEKIPELGGPLESSGFAWINNIAENFFDVFVPMLVGGVPTGILAGIAAYIIIRPAVAAYQARRRTKLELRRQKLAERREKRAAASQGKEESNA